MSSAPNYGDFGDFGEVERRVRYIVDFMDARKRPILKKLLQMNDIRRKASRAECFYSNYILQILGDTFELYDRLAIGHQWRVLGLVDQSNIPSIGRGGRVRWENVLSDGEGLTCDVFTKERGIFQVIFDRLGLNETGGIDHRDLQSWLASQSIKGICDATQGGLKIDGRLREIGSVRKYHCVIYRAGNEDEVLMYVGENENHLNVGIFDWMDLRARSLPSSGIFQEDNHDRGKAWLMDCIVHWIRKIERQKLDVMDDDNACWQCGDGGTLTVCDGVECRTATCTNCAGGEFAELEKYLCELCRMNQRPLQGDNGMPVDVTGRQTGELNSGFTCALDGRDITPPSPGHPIIGDSYRSNEDLRPGERSPVGLTRVPATEPPIVARTAPGDPRIHEHLVHAIQNGSMPEVICLLSGRDVDLSRRDKEGKTPLHIAVKYGRFDAAKLLLQRDKSVINAFTEPNLGRNRSAALHYAAHNGDGSLARLLMDNGADVNLRLDSDHATALHIAVIRQHTDVVRCLCESRDIDCYLVARDGVGDGRAKTPLEMAKERKSYEIAMIVQLRMSRGREWIDPALVPRLPLEMVEGMNLEESVVDDRMDEGRGSLDSGVIPFLTPLMNLPASEPHTLPTWPLGSLTPGNSTPGDSTPGGSPQGTRP